MLFTNLIGFFSFLFVFCFIQKADATVSIDTMFAGPAGQDTIHIYVNYSANTDTDRVGFLRYGANFAKQTMPYKLMAVGNGQLDFFLDSLTPGDNVPVKFCSWRPGESQDCSNEDTFKMADPDYFTSIDIFNVTGKINFILDNNDPTLYLWPIWDEGLAIDATYSEGNVETFGVADNEMKSIDLPALLPDTYALAILFINDKLQSQGLIGSSDTVVKVVVSVDEIMKLESFSIGGDKRLKVSSVRPGNFSLYDITGREVYKTPIEREKIIPTENLLTGVYFYRFTNEKGEKTGKIPIIKN